MFTDTELGMAAGFSARLRDESDYAQGLINRVHGDLQKERAAHRKTAAALDEAYRLIASLQGQLDEVDALLQ